MFSENVKIQDLESPENSYGSILGVIAKCCLFIDFYITDCTGSITSKGDVLIKIGETKKKKIGTEMDAIQLSIFSHRFMSLAEQMGR